jgi:hypothetical protein
MPVYTSTIEVQFECDEQDRRATEDGLARAVWEADSRSDVSDIFGVRVHVAEERHIEYLGHQVECGVQVVDPTGAEQCGCQEIMSPVPGVLFIGEVGTEVQRCDTHRPEPRFRSDFEAADYLTNWGVEIERKRKEPLNYGYFVKSLGDFEAGQSEISLPPPTKES